MRKTNSYNIIAKAKRIRPVRLAFLFCVLILAAVLVTPLMHSKKDDAPAPAQVQQPEQTAENCTAAPAEPATSVIKGTVKPGDTVSDILGQYISTADIHTLAQKCASVFPLSRINAGRDYSIVAEDNSLRQFVYDIDSDERLVVNLDDNGFEVNRVPIDYDVSTVMVKGTITDSLFQAVEDAGEHDALAFALGNIFEWDVDFARDLREGDSFRVVVEKRYLDGNFAGYGKILAARFDNQGDSYYAFLYTDGAYRPSYYSSDGHSMRKAFLKAPLKFTRISSSFSWKRFHPILHEFRAHPAIDYAAPVGTPVRTIGDGVVTFVGVNGGAGRMIKVRHRNGYETWYSHLHGYARGIRTGTSVSQGQIIGYVGSSGLATGPHLDFRMRLGGKYINPLAVKTPPANNVSRKNMADFSKEVKEYTAVLDEKEPLQAKVEDKTPPEVRKL
ncbi:Peptidase M23 [Desulfovibrio sp. X2]|uniref:M23 family metallopeptidase n=1 Tax=Desulfovibrio sp. X2 TaxID=941449 RepID=UPI000358D6E3|nr:peptidoglycan DD-metalloendopeptidase family protein [Desulfovibrio sp. X2]EPR41422.1 Peptidase M23 [Desulfovibrio sp. X2]